MKRKSDGTIDKYKARLVAKGFTQIAGIYYTETFAPVCKLDSIRAVLTLAAVKDFEVHQMDVTTAFLNGQLKEDLYMEQPEGFIDTKNPEMVCLLKKGLYGLKQASKEWYDVLQRCLPRIFQINTKSSRSWGIFWET